MDNEFQIQYNKENGGVSALFNKADKDRMNWAQGKNTWGVILDSELVSIQETDHGIIAVYQTSHLLVTVNRRLENNRFKETYTFEPRIAADVFVGRGQVGIYATFNDSYEQANICMTQRCDTHIWCGRNTSYVEAIKMGVCGFGLGMVLTKGSLDTYSVERKNISEDRGDFIFHPSAFKLIPGEKMTLEWELFWFQEGTFFQTLEKYNDIMLVKADNYTVFSNECIRFSVNKPDVQITLDHQPIQTISHDGRTDVEYIPQRIGHHCFVLRRGERETIAEFYVQIPFKELVQKRVHFIVQKQQYLREGSALDGAYLIYDNQDQDMAFDYLFRDFNASRERLVMGLLVAKYLQYDEDQAVYQSLMKYYDFVRREFFDEEKGEVYDTIGKNAEYKRLYNAPWMSVFMLELYNLTKDKAFLEKMLKLLRVFYSVGGDTFYPNGLSLYESVAALRQAGMHQEADELTALYQRHADNIVKRGVFYPAIEVRYEQSIVTPAAVILAQMVQINHDEALISECKRHLEILERFNGHQPSHFLYDVAIRHWDGYWFGKRQNYGDTMPHSASIHTSNAFLHYSWISGDETYRRRAHAGARNCLSLFRTDGSAASSYLYPFSVNGVRCEYYEDFANEQDGYLYYMIKFFGYLEDKEK